METLVFNWHKVQPNKYWTSYISMSISWYIGFPENCLFRSAIPSMLGIAGIYDIKFYSFLSF